jgi:hypothetical protein
MDFTTILYLYFILIAILIYLYIHTVKNRLLITGIVSILSSSTLVIGLVNYISNEKDKNIQDTKTNQKNYIDFISGSFDKIDNYYINNPKQLHSLFYEFYGYNNFPEKYDDNDNNVNNNNVNNNHIINNNTINNVDINNIDDDSNKNIDKTINNITAIEYITLLKIIQYIEIMFIINENIFTDLNFRNRIINYTNSKKFRRVLAYNKNNYSNAFLIKMNELKIISSSDIEVENISIPKII